MKIAIIVVVLIAIAVAIFVVMRIRQAKRNIDTQMLKNDAVKHVQNFTSDYATYRNQASRPIASQQSAGRTLRTGNPKPSVRTHNYKTRSNDSDVVSGESYYSGNTYSDSGYSSGGSSNYSSDSGSSSGSSDSGSSGGSCD